MTVDANAEKESPDEDTSAGDGVLVGQRQSLFQVSELKVDLSNQVEKHGASRGLQGQGIVQVQQPGTAVCWERFLHVRSIRVMLVENDDSTRHVVAALLRNCNYEVIEAANGLQAWKILEDLTNHIDIILTEVVMPCLSGIALLCKIISHKTRKNIPVIMTSSHDSMGLVFKCLSKGAVDFLVKPIRKNELKNLWQHVWRRCHSSSGSGSESGTQTQKSVKSKSSEKSENASDDGENDESNGLTAGDGSDNGSGTQSSWTKQAVEVDSSQALSPIDQVAECADSTCALVIHPNAEHSANKRVETSVPKEAHEQKQHETVHKDKVKEKTVARSMGPQYENYVEIPDSLMGSKVKSFSESDCNQSMNKFKTCDPPIGFIEFQSTKEVADHNATEDSKEPNVELSLKRLRGVEETGRPAQEYRYVLHRSGQSAFSRYITSSKISKAPNGIPDNSTLLDYNIKVPKNDSVRGKQAHSTDNVVCRSSSGVGNNIDMGSTTDALPKHQSIMKGTSIINVLHPCAFRPVKTDFVYNQQVNHLSNGVQATQCGSTNVLGMGMDRKHMNCSSASGSNNGSNGQKESNPAVNGILGTNGESDFHQAGKSSSGDASGSGSGNMIDVNKLAQREAALTKFRQKRKERCFRKKVRYHNRKKLAEQRPRVRGQFVKQTGLDSSDRTADE